MKSKVFIKGALVQAKVYSVKADGLVLRGEVRYRDQWVKVWTSVGGIWFATEEE